MAKILAIVAVISLMLFGNSCSTQNQTAEQQVAFTAKTSKVFEIKSVGASTANSIVDFTWEEAGKKRSFAEMAKGKVVFLNFWGTWCPPCRKEIPDIIKLTDDLKSEKVLIVGVASERNASTAKETVEAFVDKNDINYVNFLDNARELAAAYGGIQYVPTTFVINAKGEVVDKIIGGNDYNTFLAYIRKAQEN